MLYAKVIDFRKELVFPSTVEIVKAHHSQNYPCETVDYFFLYLLGPRFVCVTDYSSDSASKVARNHVILQVVELIFRPKQIG